MKFGKEFRIHLEETLPDWRDKFLCYKPLKKLLKRISPPNPIAAADGDDSAIFHGNVCIEDWFIRILDEELDKINDFYIDKEEDFVIRLQELKERIEKVRARSNETGAFKSESEFNEEMLEIRKAFVIIHGEMVLLKNYSSLNFAGLVKILKKYDKRTGALLRLPFTQRALHQPFFTTEPLTRLVKECEANLELLFPLEAEITESTSEHPVREIDPSRAVSSLGKQDANLEVYRSTLAAMRAIQGLRKASSTYNPLSLAQFFNEHDDDGNGAVTAESSVSNSPTSTVK